ncbi:hypothetical protein B0H21DRAFT_756090 [Amylocystis lapponica]|nr:hypothetical protein B0H21DRAFT_756090 [Amylocystis lapponica]
MDSISPPRALQNDDILREIFQYFRIGTRLDSERLLLVKAACICKAFLEPALAQLWKELDSLVPILRLLSSSTVLVEHKEDYYNTKNVYIIHAPVLAHEWTRATYYARLVRKLSCGYMTSGIHPSVPSELNYIGEGKPLFPSLTSLEVYRPSGIDLLFLMSPTLRDVKIGPDSSLFWDRKAGDLYACGRFICTLSLQVPSLRTLRISGSSHPLLLGYIPHFKQLQTLEMTVNTASILPLVATMDRLTTLFVTFPNEVADSNIIINPGFETLDRLEVHITEGCPMLCVSRFLEAISSPDLQHALFTSILLRDSRAWLDFRNCLASFALRCGSTVQTIHIKIGTAWARDEETYGMMDHITPLLAMRQLKRVHVEYEYITRHTPLTREDITAIATAWPDITDLTIECPPDHKLPSLDCLVDFTSYCPNLRMLAIPGMATELSHVDMYPLLDHGLKILAQANPRYMSMEDPVNTARFLDHIFPHLDVSASKKMCTQGEWMNVFDIIAALQAARVEQMRRLEKGEYKE